MKKLYENDGYIQNFKAKVIDCQPDGAYYQVVLDESAFFPEGGGQNCDLGTIDDIEVIDVQEKDDVVYHKVKSPLSIGQTVTGQIDWQRRFDYMQQHSGEHILSGIVHRKFGYNNVGFHLGERIVTLDFDGVLTKDDLVDIENQVNQAIFENRSIVISYPSKEELKTIDYRSKIDIPGQVRLVTVEGYDVCACCAPHVDYTGSVGLLKILSCQNYKGGVRLSIACGRRALEDYRVLQDNAGRIGVLLSVKPEETADAVSHLYEEQKQLKYDLMVAKEENVLCKLKGLDCAEGVLCLFETSIDGSVMKRVFNAMGEMAEHYFALFSGDDAEGYKYMIGTRDGDARVVGQALKAKFECRGGGKPEMIQGQIKATKAEIEEVLREIK